MQIEVNCPQCATRLRIPQEHAGKKASCPKCKTTFTIPTQNIADLDTPSSNSFGSSGSALPPVDSISSSGPLPSRSNMWRVRTQDGTEYGPIDKNELDSWSKEGRVTASDFLLREGTSQWVAASSIYPNLASAAAPGEFSDFELESTSPPSSNPFDSGSQFNRGRSGRKLIPHQGGTILTLGILGIVCCDICAPFAWVMGNGDLQKMEAGIMDPEGKGTTQAGRILGIVGTVIIILKILGIMLLAAAG